MPNWPRLRSRLDALTASAPPPPQGGRLGAALALLRETDGGDLALVLTRRRDDLSTHPGQISFPGGRVDPGETVPAAALREAAEECALDPATATVLGVLPAFYIPPSRYWLQVVVARWDAPHALHPAEAEVAEILSVRFSELADPARWRVVQLSARATTWAWDLGDEHVLWGATAIATSVLLGMVDPDWCAGTAPQDLPPEREVRPWEGAPAVAGRGRPRLPDVPELAVHELPDAPAAVDPPTLVGQVGGVVADAAAALRSAGDARVLVLAGPGWTGTVGLCAAVELVRRDVDVCVVLAAAEEADGGVRGAALRELRGRVGVVAEELPPAGLVIDAVTGRGLDGPLRPPVLQLVLALRSTSAPVLSVDLPSGVHPERGLVGDAVSADVTLALGAPAIGLLDAGIAPFVGDLYLIGLPVEPGTSDPLVRVGLGAPRAGWRE